MNKNLISVGNYCKKSGIRRRTVYYQIKRGDLPSVKIDGVIFIDLSLETLNLRTLKPQNIRYMQYAGLWHYINHVDGVATKGFETRESLLGWTRMLVFTPASIDAMRKRYVQLYNKH